ncbi:hypothetical protein G3N56_11710 [Desulfovibrio sulfodismutans]|uniref:Phage head morphogenesis domain-containing protein n=1 Tax=Desulfolutivibrio sulfodismutans TaxID=63561 RepID=A0A7K3NMQ3_9BACT|nr:phage minor head protein [Desulfolutivibrio sulfodismutans]NDY57407.1 hypothetical protein [Desulfolutivibrio sulfodismutans]QLA11889.1 hypothetical protein GD606_06245 [Desulfolutivibrio sulfodismutans DSM 3696]QLA13548.1 hypothetical protein GD606_15380 [Desulfolutivibrio sulfodismutans DSM 3696]
MAIEFKAVAPAESVAYLEARGHVLTPTFDWREMWQGEHTRAFTVAKSAGFDVLKDIEQAVLRAKSEGRTLKQFAAELTPILQAKGWWGKKDMTHPDTGQVVRAQLGSPRRLQIIYDTNMRTAHAAGTWARYERTKHIAPYLRYVAILDGKTRPEHRAWHGIVLRGDHPWWKMHFPPNGWHCRCVVIQLSEAQLRELGYEISPDLVIEMEKYVNPRTGQEIYVPKGIDPGFAYNPGQAALENHAARAMLDKLPQASADLAAAQAASARFVVPALKHDLSEWVQGKLTAMETGAPISAGERRVVGALDQKVIDFMREKKAPPECGAITLSDKGIAHLYREGKQASGVGLSRETIARVVDALWEPEAVYWDKANPALLYLIDAGDGAGKLVVRVNHAVRMRVAAPGEELTKQTVVTNDLWSGRVIDPKDMENTGMFERIF